MATLRRFTVTLFCYRKNIGYISFLVNDFLKVMGVSENYCRKIALYLYTTAL